MYYTMGRSGCVLWLAVILAAPPLWSAGAQNLDVGFQVGVLQPLGGSLGGSLEQTTGKNPALQVGFHADWSLASPFSLRARADTCFFRHHHTSAGVPLGLQRMET